MLALHPDFIEKNGLKVFAVIPYEEFLKVEEVLEDYEDLKTLRHAKKKEGHCPGVSLKQARTLLGI